MALIALYREWLHNKHYYFSLALHHPSANQALKILASRYVMPARMWRHGIHSVLELLRHRLPASLEHMLAFVCLAYSMIALLYKTSLLSKIPLLNASVTLDVTGQKCRRLPQMTHPTRRLSRVPSAGRGGRCRCRARFTLRAPEIIPSMG